MNNKEANIPEFVLDWIAQYSYEELEPDQQSAVLEYVDAEEYRSMHAALGQVQSVQPEPYRNDRIKAALSDRFDKVYSGNSDNSSRKASLYWRAAAILLLATSGALAVLLVNKGNSNNGIAAKLVDTIYVARSVPSAVMHVHDTVYLTTAVARGNSNSRNIARQEKRAIAKPVAAAASMGNSLGSGEISVVSVTELQQVSNASKKNSMKYDSMARQFAYTVL